MKTGIYYDIPEHAYHGDPCDGNPAFSASTAKTLWLESPLHAWSKHPILNHNFTPDDDKKFSLGVACHALFLEGDGRKIVVVEAEDWRTKAAKEKRDEALASGLTPLLSKQYDQAMKIVGASRKAVMSSELAIIMTNGSPEVTLISEEFGFYSKSRLDWLSNDRGWIIDYKVTGTSANPSKFINQIFQMGYDIQAAIYLDMNHKTGGPEDAKFVWIVQEDTPPFATSIVGASHSVVEIGRQKMKYCQELWRKCLMENYWPSYPKEICWAEAPTWEQDRTTTRLIMNQEGDEI